MRNIYKSINLGRDGMLLIFFITAILMVSFFNFINGNFLLFGDTDSYVRRCYDIVGTEAHRSIGYPLAMLIFSSCSSSDFIFLHLIQILLYCFSASLFLKICLREASTLQIRTTIVIHFFIFFCLPTMILWNHSALTESLNISLYIILVILFSSKKINFYVRNGFICLIVAYLVILKDSNVILFLLALHLMIEGWRLGGKDRIWTLFTVFLLGIVVFYNITESGYTMRWLVPLLNNIGKRVLTNSAAIEFFSQHGMPVTDTLLTFSDKWADVFMRDHQHNDLRSWAREGGAAGIEFTKWIVSSGKLTYALYLLSNWHEVIFSTIFKLIIFPDFSGYAAQSVTLGKLFGFINPKLFNLYFSSIMAFLILWLFWQSLKDVIFKQDYRFFNLLITSFCMAFISLYADAMERERHVFPANLLVCFAAVIRFAENKYRL
jgi:hypothetical protein